MTESKMWVARGWGEEAEIGEFMFNGYEASVCNNEGV